MPETGAGFMEKNRHSRNRHHNRNWNEQKKSINESSFSSRNFQANSSAKSGGTNQRRFQFVNYENPEALAQREQAIKELKAREVVCPKCGKLITDIASAMTDKVSGKPIHFECVMEQVSSGESVGQNEKIAYIGQGRFAVLFYENIRDQRHFHIKKIIEWEGRDSKPEWRDEISGLYSQVE